MFLSPEERIGGRGIMLFKIYVVRNLINEKKYVGITTMTLNKRWICHKSEAKNGKNTTRTLYRAIRKYGPENFAIERIEVCNTREEGMAREKYWIENLNTFLGEGYNRTEGGDGTCGLEWKEGRKEAYRERWLGKNNPNSRGNEYHSFYGKNHTEETKREMSESRIGISWGSHTKESKTKISESQYKEVSQYTPEGKLVKTYRSVQEAAEAVEGKPSGVQRIAAGKSTRRKHHRGFKWKYTNFLNSENDVT